MRHFKLKNFVTGFCFLGILAVLSLAVHRHVSAAGMLKVDQVYEADLLKLSDGRVIRLIGVDAPKINDPQRNAFLAQKKKLNAENIQSVSYLAIRYVKNILEGKSIYVTYDKAFEDSDHQDDQGRIFAYLWFPVLYKDNREREGGRTFLGITSQDRLLNGEIIKLGYGVSDQRAAHTYRKIFDDYENRAKADKKGMWQDKEPSYQDLLMRGQGALVAAMADYVPDSVRKMGLEFARKTFSQLIDMNPSDYRAYYNRSWVGMDSFSRKVTEDNLADIDKALQLAPDCASCYAHKHFLLRMLHRHQEASEAYRQAVLRSPKLLEGPFILESMKRSLANQAAVLRLENLPRTGGLMEDAYRAGLNDQQFLFFMSRYKDLEGLDPAIKSLFNGLIEQPRFLSFYQTHEPFLKEASSEDILYSTDYAKRGLTDPEGALERMNRR